MTDLDILDELCPRTSYYRDEYFSDFDDDEYIDEDDYDEYSDDDDEYDDVDPEFDPDNY